MSNQTCRVHCFLLAYCSRKSLGTEVIFAYRHSFSHTLYIVSICLDLRFALHTMSQYIHYEKPKQRCHVHTSNYSLLPKYCYRNFIAIWILFTLDILSLVCVQVTFELVHIHLCSLGSGRTVSLWLSDITLVSLSQLEGCAKYEPWAARNLFPVFLIDGPLDMNCFTANSWPSALRYLSCGEECQLMFTGSHRFFIGESTT
jgi:hypothetical protein